MKFFSLCSAPGSLCASESVIWIFLVGTTCLPPAVCKIYILRCLIELLGDNWNLKAPGMHLAKCCRSDTAVQAKWALQEPRVQSSPWTWPKGCTTLFRPLRQLFDYQPPQGELGNPTGACCAEKILWLWWLRPLCTEKSPSGCLSSADTWRSNLKVWPFQWPLIKADQ